MSKRVLKWFSILFLSSILVLSCSNASKTGSGDNNSGNGGSGTGGDGGTTPTPEGIAKYAGTWTAKFDANNSYEVIINTDGKVTIDNGSVTKKEATDIKKEAENKYTMNVQHSTGIEASTVTITFTDEKSGTITDTSDAFGGGIVGVIKKQNGGNKGLWYYSGTWGFQETNPGTEKGTIIIQEDGSVSFEIQQQPPYTSKDVTDKGNETYEVKFVDETDTETLILTLKFNNDDDSTGSYEAKLNNITSTGTLTKQK
ncbi:hypothetical protein [Brachyspira pilosicoli]|uniref:hypothetical protein n=1 Tax=Brachyspira pilosicoli TaxID=52584 RepID=UPI000E1A14AE|nr:hypothetical protein [Brachyspira pilosicoli]SUW00674.1 Uncharacterised protein [Brachyspira pilosicoli]